MWLRGGGAEMGDGDYGVPGQGRPGAPEPGGAPTPWQRSDAQQKGVQYRRVPIWPPFANLARDPNVLYLIRNRPLVFGGAGVVAGTLAPQQLPFSQPTIVFARTAAAVIADFKTGFPVGMNPLDSFAAQIQRTTGDLLDGTSTPILGSALWGKATLPALYAGNGLFFNNGSTLIVTVQTLMDNVRADLVFWTIEEYGPAAGR